MNDVIFINLGVRDFSTIPQDVPIEKWLYDQAWMKKYNSLHQRFLRFVDSKIDRKKWAKILFIIVSSLLMIGAFYIQQQVNENKSAANKKLIPVLEKNKPILDKTIVKRSEESVAPQVLLSQHEPINLAETIQPTENVATKNEVITRYSEPEQQNKNAQLNVTASSVKVEGEKKSDKRDKRAYLTQNDRVTLSTPKEKLMGLNMVSRPPIPQEIAGHPIPTKPTIAKEILADAKPRKWMAIEEVNENQGNHAAARDVSKETVAKANVHSIETTVETTPKQTQVVLHDYKIVTLTKNSVVIFDPEQKRHKQIFVSNKLPNGEVIMEVNEESGIVMTNLRKLQMK